jgi:hypothetical protein
VNAAVPDTGPLPVAPPPSVCPGCRRGPLRLLLETSAPIHTSKLLASRRIAEGYPRGPIRLELCEACGLITNTAFDAPRHDYSASYEETQAFSPRFQEYAGQLAATLSRRHGLAGADVLEIGCGRADFLLRLCEVGGCSGTGIDPSFREDALDGPAAERVTVRRAFFSESDVDRPYALIVCRHTLEHVHDVHDFLVRLRSSLDGFPRTTVFFEVPDTTRILRETAFWDMYYEHCTYFTPGSMARAFRAAGFRPITLELGFDDQYILLTAVPSDRPSSAPPLPLEESAAEIVSLAGRFVDDLEATRAYWTHRLQQRRANGETSVLWGAGSKGVGFLSTLGLSDEVAGVVDVNPAKHGMFMPGSGHEIIPPSRLRELQPGLVIVMNPAYTEEIRRDIEQLGVSAEVEALMR